MKTCFIINVAPAKIAIADLTHMGGRIYEINRINVPPQHRGKRHGSDLLKQVLAEADAQRMTLRLFPLASGGLGTKKLIAWYERHGFTRYTDPGHWYRLPAGQSDLSEVKSDQLAEIVN